MRPARGGDGTAFHPYRHKDSKGSLCEGRFVLVDGVDVDEDWGDW